MSQNKILIDTNTYFRLAQSVHPLLRTGFGVPPKMLFITHDLEKEFKRNARLKSKFGWFWQNEYETNRSAPIKLSKKEQKQFEADRPTFVGIANNMGLYGISLVDISIATHASILNIPLVTDDNDLIYLSKELEIEVMTTLELLKMMLDCKHVDLPKIRAIAGYWIHIADCPKDFKNQYKALFNEDPPN